MPEGFLELAIWVFILAAIAVATLIRKAIEKAAAGEEGKKIDVGKAVQTQLRKYMRAIEGTGRFGPPSPPVEEEAAAPPALPAREAAIPPARPKTPRPVDRPPTEPERTRPRSRLRREPLVVGRVAVVMGQAKPVSLLRGVHLDHRRLKESIVLAEVLGPPMAVRQEHRLF